MISPSFTQLSLPAPFLHTLVELGYESPTPIQEKAIPLLLEGKDLVGQAQTGTGKTAAFALPLLARLDLKKKFPQVLVLAPTRELAIQVAEAFQAYARHLKGFHVLPVYGGQGYAFQLEGLKRGVHVVVGTPGRILDHLERGTLKIDGLSAVVLDEADEMLRMGFIEDVEKIVSGAPKECQMAMFSATMPSPIRRIAQRYLKDPSEVKIASRTTTVEAVEQRYLLLDNDQKMEALTRLLEVEEYHGVLIFVRTKSATTEVAEKLEARGFAAAALNGDMSQSQREKTITRLKSRKLDIVVATDVAARGLDVESLSLVINYDIPHDTESYVHRIGRTGRAGRGGKAILFVAPRERHMLKAIEHATKQRIESSRVPSSRELGQRRAEIFRERVAAALAGESMDFFQACLEDLKRDLGLSLSDLAPVLLYLAQKDIPLKVEERDLEPRQDKGRAQKGNLSGPRERTGKMDQKKSRVAFPTQRYRLELGKKHKVRVADIVAAISRGADIDGKYIGNIQLHEDYSTVELPQGMPRETLRHLKKVHIRQQKLNLRPMES